ncbi:MAG TPA: ribonuclease HII [Candidatus Paceibacterota bacterium]|nr:ribonuclease HII [Candidatus Paceibacterota bacterium]
MKFVPKAVIGVDEAGRGPLAGPVAVGFVLVPKGFDVAKEFPGVDDSKKLTEGKREELFEMLTRRAERGDISYCVRYGSHAMIDARGMTRVVRAAIGRGVRTLAPESRGVHVYLDGLLHAPQEYSQETVIHGDSLIPIISLASIAAKVSRDRLMQRYEKKFPGYGFAVHKGYGTKLHYQMLSELGPSEIHRRSYLPSR